MLTIRVRWYCEGCGEKEEWRSDMFARVPSDLTIPEHPFGWSIEFPSACVPWHFCPTCTKARQSATKELANAPEDQTRTHSSHVREPA